MDKGTLAVSQFRGGNDLPSSVSLALMLKNTVVFPGDETTGSTVAKPVPVADPVVGNQVRLISPGTNSPRSKERLTYVTIDNFVGWVRWD